MSDKPCNTDVAPRTTPPGSLNAAPDGSRLYLVATLDLREPRILRATSATGAILARFKDEDDPIRYGTVGAWALGNFPEQFEVLDREPEQPFLRPIGRPRV